MPEHRNAGLCRLRLALAAAIGVGGLLVDGARAAPSKLDTLTCSFEQQLLFADNPSDYPSGPAYFGSNQPIVVPEPNGDNFTETEAELTRTTMDFVKKNHGAKFTVDLGSGALESIPFGAQKTLIITFNQGEPVVPRILTSNKSMMTRGYYFIGYYISTSKNYVAILMIEPPKNGSRTFQYMAIGETLLGYCD